MNVASPRRRGFWRVLCPAVVMLAAASPAARAGRSPLLPTPSKATQLKSAATQKAAKERMQRIPLYYEANIGQADPAVQVISRGGGFVTLLTGSETYFVNSSTPQPFGLKFLGAANSPKAILEEELPGVSHYYQGKDPAKWRTGVKHYARARFSEVYPGVDVLFYSGEKRMEYDFVVAPGADPSVIRMAWTGVEATRVDESGDLVVTTAAGDIRQKRPVVFQEVGGKRLPVEARYRKNTDGVYSLDLGDWDRQYALVIDPSLQYSTYIGGSLLEESTTMLIDQAGNAVIGGYTFSTNFPVAPISLTFIGTNEEAFVTKLNNDGTQLMFSVFLGGEAFDTVSAITTDSNGSYYITGRTQSFSFPSTPNVFQIFFSGLQDAFLCKISANGSQLIYSTFFGMSNSYETSNAIGVDSNGNAVIAGSSSSSSLPTTPGAFDRTANGGDDGFVARFSANGQQLLMSTFLGGAGVDIINGMTQDVAGELYLVGTTSSADFPTTTGAYQRTLSGAKDAFVCKMSQNGQRVSFCSLFGGTGAEEGTTVALETGGRVVIAGSATVGTFPATALALRKVVGGDSDAFVARLNSQGTSVIAATLLGGLGVEFLGSVISMTGGYMAVGGTTTSLNFPSTREAFQFSSTASGDGFLSVITPLGNELTYSTIIGGTITDQIRAIARDRFGDVYVAGASNSSDLITVPGSFDTTLNGSADVFVARILGISGQECVGTVTSTATTYGFNGGGGGIGIASGCTWNAFSAAPWVTFVEPATVLSQSEGSLNYVVAPSTSPEPRTASIHAAGNLVQILQKGTASIAPYGDVPADNLFADYIRIIKTNAVTTGCSATNFCPSDTTTRGQMAVFIVRSVLGTDDFTVRAEPYFSDVQPNHPLFKWIQKMREMNITTGCGLVTYCPNDPVTRGQMAVFLVRAKYGDNFNISNTPYFTDVPSNNLFFSYIQKLRQLGITAGCTATNYCPNDANTRAQMAVFLTRMFFTPW